MLLISQIVCYHNNSLTSINYNYNYKPTQGCMTAWSTKHAFCLEDLLIKKIKSSCCFVLINKSGVLSKVFVVWDNLSFFVFNLLQELHNNHFSTLHSSRLLLLFNYCYKLLSSQTVGTGFQVDILWTFNVGRGNIALWGWACHSSQVKEGSPWILPDCFVL
jgi:hypothetical protein